MNPSDILKQAASFWQKLGNTQKVSIGALGAVTLAAFIALGFWASNPSYALLYANLSAEDASAIVQKLEDQKIPVKLSNGGTTIHVPSEKVYSARLKMAGEGLPKGSYSGFELFDNSLVGMTDFMQKVNYIRALQGELARTISEIDEVASVRVHIVIPEESLFEENKKEPTASVVLKLKSGAVLSKQQVAGIRYLVAGSVVGLKTGNITIVDNNGAVLSSASGENSIEKLNQEQLEAQKNVDRYLEEKVQSMLDTVLGPKKAIVKVTAELNFQKVDKTIESYDPNSAVVRRESISNQKRSETPAQRGGVPGTKPNVTLETQSELTGGRNIKDNKENIQNEYEIDRTVQRVVAEVGNIKRLSVAVFIAQKPGAGGQPAPRTQQEMTDIENMVKAAVGYQNDPLLGRVDDIKVRETNFDTSHMDEEARQMQSSQRMALLAIVLRYLAIGAVGGGLLFLIYTLVNGMISPEPKTGAAGGPAGKSGKSRAAQEELDMAALEEMILKELPDLKEGEEGVRQLEKYLGLLAQERTDEFVNLVKNWLQTPSATN